VALDLNTSKEKLSSSEDNKEAAAAKTEARQPLPLHSRARLAARTALAVGLVGLAVWIAADFLPAVTWAGIFALASWPPYERFASRFVRGTKSPVAALLFTLVIGVTIFLPFAAATYQVAQQSQMLASWVAQTRDNGIPVPEWLAQVPIAADVVTEWWRQNLADPKAAARWLEMFNAENSATWISALGGELLHRIFMFFVSLIALFVLLRNGEWMAKRALDTADRIFGDPGENLASKMVLATRGTMNGTIVVAVVEGLLIGLAYALAGVPNAVLFTIVTMAFAMLPFGAWAAFTAAAVTLLLSGGNAWAAGAVFSWGAFVMLIGDHFVWPALVGGAARLPFLFALVGVFGGLATFGLVGLFVGPVIMAALLTVWREWLMEAR
jgi:predicted PurR-regulated permease PerM